MKYFICALDGKHWNSTSYLGIPAEQTERLIPADRTQTVVYETDNEEAFILLPALFDLKDRDAPHGLILKNAPRIKTILLSPRIENEMEIPPQEIHQLPDALSAMHTYFTGIFFTDDKVILILDPEKLLECSAQWE